MLQELDLRLDYSKSKILAKYCTEKLAKLSIWWNKKKLCHKPISNL